MVGLNKLLVFVKAHSKLVIVAIMLIILFLIFTQKEEVIVLRDNATANLPSASTASPLGHENFSNGINCNNNMDCDDNNTCTFDYCLEGICAHDINGNTECITAEGTPGYCDTAGICSPKEASCDNGIDDDGNGLIDCQDPVCDGSPCLINGSVSGICQAGICLPS